jgi:dCTP deaminase
MKKETDYFVEYIPETGYTLMPNVLYLGRTVEYTETHNYVAQLEGKSSVGRLGISIHSTAGFGDVGFKGYWTLEISCVQQVKIYPNVRIGQLFYNTVSEKHNEYNSDKYQNNKGIQTSKFYKDLK